MRRSRLVQSLHSERAGLSALIERGYPRHRGTGEPDGFWFEHSPFYATFYVLTALIPLLRAAESAGALSTRMREHFTHAFHAPLHLVDHELRLLSISDRVAPGTMRLIQARHLYEYAAGQLSPGWGGLLALLYQRCGAPRASLAALAYGPDELPQPLAPPQMKTSVVLPEAGLATFRSNGDGPPVTLWFQNLRRYPGSAQGHHHMDRLSFSLHAAGVVVTSDPGWPGCESAESGRGAYLSGTLAHNTLMLDEYDQPPPADQVFLAEPGAAIPWAHGGFRGNSEDKLFSTFREHHGGRLQEGVYDDAYLDRTLWFDHHRVVILDRLRALTEKRLGLLLHARGMMNVETLPVAEVPALRMPPLPVEGAWRFFTGRAAADPIVLLVADWRVKSDLYLRAVVVATDGCFDAHYGSTSDNPAEIRRGSLVLRAPGKERTFATVLELHAGTPKTAGVRAGADAVSVIDYDGEEKDYPLPPAVVDLQPDISPPVSEKP